MHSTICIFFFFLFRTLFFLFFLFLFLNFFLFSFLSFFIDSLIENYIMFQPLSSQLMQPNNSFLFIFLMFISFVLLFYFLFLSFYFYFPLFLQSLVSIYLFSCTQSMFNNKLFVHILEWVMPNVYFVKWFYFLYMLTCLACVYMLIKIN